MAWNGSNGASAPKKIEKKGASAVYRGALAGLLVVVGVGVGFYFINKPTVAADKKSIVKEKTSSLIEAVDPAMPSPVMEEEEAPKQEVKKVDPAKIKEVKRLQALSKEEREDIAYQRLKDKPLDLTPKTNRIFRTGTEASLARIFMTRVGDPPPPFFTTKIPLRDEAHLAEILIADNPALETDSDAQRETKEMVELAKKEMVQFIKEGGDPEEFLEYYHGKLQEAHIMRSEAMKSFMAIAREDPTIAADYLDRLNQSLDEKGIRTIELSESQKQRFGIEY